MLTILPQSKLARASVFMVAGFAAAFVLATPAQAEQLSGSEFTTKLNAQRAESGIPRMLSLDPIWSSNCRKHNVYTALNGGWDSPDPHGETPGKPGYTTEGAAAAQQSVLGFGSGWTTLNPWEDKPLHLAKLLSPTLTSIGFDHYKEWMCAWNWTHSWDHPSNTLYPYPGDGARSIYYAERTAEWPTSPAAMAGLPNTNNVIAGPYLIIMGDGPWLRNEGYMVVKEASLRGPNGAVQIGIIDAQTASSYRSKFKTRAFILPLKPLQPNTTYHASVRVDKGGVVLTRSWSFTTGNTKLDIQGGDTGEPGEPTPTGPSGYASLTRLTVGKAVFRRAQAPSVYATYTFSESASFLYSSLSRRVNGRWVAVRQSYREATVKAPLKGTRRATIKSFFGPKTVTAGVYRLTLRTDRNTRNVSFTIRP